MRVCACMYVHASMCIYACACVTVPALMRIRALSKAISVSVMARARTHLTKPNIRPINSFSSSSEKQTPIKPLSMGHQTHHSLRGVGGKMSHLFLPLQHDLAFHGGGVGGGFCAISAGLIQLLSPVITSFLKQQSKPNLVSSKCCRQFSAWTSCPWSKHAWHQVCQ